MTYTLNRSELLRALNANASSGFGPDDGTYRLIPGWIGSARTWSAERIEESSGYEVGMRPAVGDWDHSELQYQVDARYGVWTDGNGALRIDRVIHIEGTVNDALEIAAQYSQETIWDWTTSQTVPVITYPTALEV